MTSDQEFVRSLLAWWLGIPALVIVAMFVAWWIWGEGGLSFVAEATVGLLVLASVVFWVSVLT